MPRLVETTAASLRETRWRQGLTQAHVARRAGLPQSVLSQFERGRRQLRLGDVERLFEVLGLQVRLELEPLWARIDAAIAAAAGRTLQERLTELDADLLVLEELLDGIPHAHTGTGAALLHGAPVPVHEWRLAVTEEGRDEMYVRFLPPRGFARYERDFEEVTLWSVIFVGEVRAVVVEAVPDAVRVAVGDGTVPVLPLHEVEVADRDAGRVLGRLRSLRAGTTDAAADGGG